MTVKAQANPVAFSFQSAQQAYHINALARREARVALVEKLREKAQAELEYRKGKSVAFARHRGAGKPVEESKIHAEADSADFALRRDLADAEAKGASARLQELEAERASLRQLAEWSREES